MTYLNPTWRLRGPTYRISRETFVRCATAIRCHVRGIGLVRYVLRVVALALVTLVASGIAHVLAQPSRTESETAAVLIDSVTTETATHTGIPSSLHDDLGYVPVAASGNAADPLGGCSSPGQVSPGPFVDACRTHDLGYDVLRLAEAEGDRLGAWARFDIDMRFYVDMLDTCDTVRCRATATVFYSGVTANSIRQGYMAPAEEPLLPWLGVALLPFGSALLAPGRRRSE